MVDPARREGPLRSGNQFTRPEEPKGQWAIVGVTLTNKGDRNFGLSGHDFELRDASGVKYKNAVVGVAGNEWAKANGLKDGVLGLSTGQVPPGVPVKYALLFDVNPQATGLKLWLVQARVEVPLE